MRNILLILSLVAFASSLSAQSHKKQIEGLISRGNLAYEYSQPSKIKECADSINMILTSMQLNDDEQKDYSVSLLKLYGNYYYENARLDSAEFYYDKAKSIIDSNPNTDFHGSDFIMLRELAQLYYRRKEYDRALALMTDADDRLEFMYQKLGDSIWVITKMTYAMCLARVGDTAKALKIAEDELNNAIDKTSLEYSKAQRMYGKIKLLANADRLGALKAYKDYFEAQKKLALSNFSKMSSNERKEYWQTLRPFITDCYLLENADPAFLFDVTLFSKALLLQLSRISGDGPASNAALKSLDYKWTDIQNKLARNQAAIEFIQYGEEDYQKMGALILKNAGSPKFVSLTPPSEILEKSGKSISSTGRKDKDQLYNDSELQNMVWTQELLNSLDGIKKLYFAPDGYMHRLAIEYMPQVDGIEIYRLSSTRRLMDPPTSLTSDAPVLALGSINYDLDKASGNVDSNDSDAYANYLGKSFPRLDASSDETKDIIALRNNPLDSILSGAKASELSFRQLAPQYSSIILSTHGDFGANIPVATDLKPILDDDSMSQSILAFSGVNSYLTTPNFNPELHADGILSAKELSSLDLSKCNLFIASACQSALGEITPDGVFGLQRGLKNSGVDAMLLSLWSVNSDATSQLMRLFYQNLNSGMSVRKALAEARKTLMSASPVETIEYVFDPASLAYKTQKSFSKSFNSPQYTNAFILIDALD